MSNEQLLNQDGEGLETEFPARELAVAREQQGLTKYDVARELRLSEKYIDSLERGAFDELPSMVFARGSWGCCPSGKTLRYAADGCRGTAASAAP